MRFRISSLRYRIIISVVAIETVMLSIMVWSNTNQVRKAHADRLDHTAQVVLDQFAATAGRYLFEVDYPSLREYAQSVLKHDELVQILVKNKKGDSIIAIGDPLYSRESLDDEQAVTEGIREVRAEVIFAGRRLGEVHLGFTLLLMEHTVAAALRRGLVIASIAIILSIIAALLVGVTLTRNLTQFEQFVRRFGQGEEDISIPIQSSDETGMLARAFNQMMRQRRESEVRFRDFAEASADWFWETDADLRFTYVSDSVERVMGLPPEWHYGKTRKELIGKNYDHDVWAAHERDLLEHKPFRNFEYSRVTASGKIAWTSTSGIPLFADDGSFVGYRGVGSGIGERKQSEAALHESQARLAIILDTASDAIISVDADRRIVLFNKGAEAIFGYPAEEMIGQRIDRLIPLRFRDAHGSHINDFAGSTEVSRLMGGRGDISGLREDGTEFPAVASISKLELRGDELFTVILHDVTEHKRAEQQLRQAQKMEAVGQLTGGIAHDFNNLLGIILGNAELLSAQVGQGDARIEALMRAAFRGADLTQRLLAFSRQQPLQPKSIDVDALVTGMMGLLRQSLGEAIDIKVGEGEGLWTAKADPGLLESALLNLAINARDAMPGHGTLVIETSNAVLDETYAATHEDVAPGDYVLLAVTDTGSGMTPAVLEHVFEPFFTTKGVGKGSGLGLSMVYGFAKQSGGHVALYSEVGKGTTVRVYLPRSGKSADKTEDQSDTAQPTGQGEMVLVVEDDDDVRGLAVVLLESLSYRALQARDAAEAFDSLEKIPGIQLLLCDVVLSGSMSGPDLAHEAVNRKPSLRVLFMSGYAGQAIHLNGWLEKGAHLLNKPFRRHDLAQAVRSVLDQPAKADKNMAESEMRPR